MTKRKYKLNTKVLIGETAEVAPTLTTKPKTVVLAKLFSINVPVASETLIGSGETLIGNGETLIGDLTLENEVKALKKRVNRRYLEDMIVRMCRIRPFRAEDLSRLLKRNETYLHEILTALVKSKRLMYTIPEMPTHPNQMYRAND